jgi:putative chitinase
MSVDWNNFNSRVSVYFTVGEVCNYETRRIPTDITIKNRILDLAQDLDKVREWWGSAIVSNSWYRPPEVEREVGGSGANHPYGFAADIRPAYGSIWDFQSRFEREWYWPGKWKGGFGKGANKGFIHLDKRNWGSPRTWNY